MLHHTFPWYATIRELLSEYYISCAEARSRNLTGNSLVALLRVLDLEEHLRTVMYECCARLNLEVRLFLFYLFLDLNFRFLAY